MHSRRFLSINSVSKLFLGLSAVKTEVVWVERSLRRPLLSLSFSSPYLSVPLHGDFTDPPPVWLVPNKPAFILGLDLLVSSAERNLSETSSCLSTFATGIPADSVGIELSFLTGHGAAGAQYCSGAKVSKGKGQRAAQYSELVGAQAPRLPAGQSW